MSEVQISNYTEASKVVPEEVKKFRVGIIGTGGIAHPHLANYLKMNDVEVVCGADLVPGKAKAFFEEFKLDGVRCYTDYKQMIDTEKLDAVSICTYNCTHAECAIYALEHGVNVLLEKPFTVTLDEAVEVCKAEKKSGKILSIGFQPRFDPNMIMLKNVVRSGVLGKIYYIQTGGGRRRGIPTPYGTTFIEKETGGLGALADIGCYSLDMLLNSIGYPKPLSVTGYTCDFFGKDPNYVGYKLEGHPEYHKKFGVDDFAAGFVRLEGDIILDFRIAWAMNMDTTGDALILGTKGGLRIPSSYSWNGSLTKCLKLYSEVGGEQVVTDIPMKPSGVDCFELKLRSFVDAIKEDGTSPVPTSQIIYNQAIISGIQRSAELGHEIEIEIPEI